MTDSIDGLLFLEILGGILLALYLLRRVTLTLIYCILLIKAMSRATRRKFRRMRVYWIDFERHNPHGFLAIGMRRVWQYAKMLMPKFLGEFMRMLLRGYVRAELWFLSRLCPAIYIRLPKFAQNFCRWILLKVDRFTARQIARRRAHYAQKSYTRYLKRIDKMSEIIVRSCPMRAFMPLEATYNRARQSRL